MPPLWPQSRGSKATPRHRSRYRDFDDEGVSGKREAGELVQDQVADLIRECTTHFRAAKAQIRQALGAGMVARHSMVVRRCDGKRGHVLQG